MITLDNLIVPCTVISAIALLWRITSREDFLKDRIERLPYLIRKPLTCGVCFSFWVSFITQFFILPRAVLIVPTEFFVSWMLTGMFAVFIFYTFLTFYEGSHYLAHKAEKMHEEKPSETKSRTI